MKTFVPCYAQKLLLSLRLVALLVFMPATLVCAGDTATANAAELDSRVVKYHSEYYLNDDFTSYVQSEIALKVLTEAAIGNIKTTSFSYSTSIEKMEIIDAYTWKESGEKIAVPKDNYQLRVNKGNRDGGPVFSDRTTLTVVFPDVAVNDTVVISYRLTETQPMFPGHFTAQSNYYRQRAYDDVKVSINVPASLDFVHQVREMKEVVSHSGKRKIIELSYQNPLPLKSDRENYSVWDAESETGFAFSTFRDYQSIAEAYGERALPKAKPDARIKKLAGEITGKVRDKKEQARLLYDWVVTNITYAGNCIGVGAVVPHDTDFILDNKMGDCKDHATLLQALLDARGIKSTQALVNSGNAYKLPAIPMVSSVNHVINYLPDFDQFVDTTSDTSPFDMLPFADADKPVLLVQGYQAGMKTPAGKMGQNRQVMDTVIHVQEDGSVKGKVKLSLTGFPAVFARASWRDVTQEQEQDWIEGVFSSQGVKGVGSIQKDDPEPLESAYQYAIEFEKKGFIQGSGSGAFYIGPLLPTPAPVYSFVDYPDEDIQGYDVVCRNGAAIETYAYHFPANIKLLATPDDFEINQHHIHYRSTYKTDKNVLYVTLMMDDTTPGNTCSSELVNKQKEVLVRITQSLSSQVVYQR